MLTPEQKKQKLTAKALSLGTNVLAGTIFGCEGMIRGYWAFQEYGMGDMGSTALNALGALGCAIVVLIAGFNINEIARYEIPSIRRGVDIDELSSHPAEPRDRYDD